MIMTNHKISDDFREYYFLIEYFDDGVKISYWENIDGVFKKNLHHEILIDPTNAKELFKVAYEQCEVEYDS